MFDRLLDLPRPPEISGSAAERLRAIERQIAGLLGGDPFKVEERFRRLAELAARAEALAREHERIGSSEGAP